MKIGMEYIDPERQILREKSWWFLVLFNLQTWKTPELLQIAVGAVLDIQVVHFGFLSNFRWLDASKRQWFRSWTNWPSQRILHFYSPCETKAENVHKSTWPIF